MATHCLKVWAPDGSLFEAGIEDRSELAAALRRIAEKAGCRLSELDYQVGDGIRIIGDGSALEKGIDYCGLPPSDPD